MPKGSIRPRVSSKVAMFIAFISLFCFGAASVFLWRGSEVEISAMFVVSGFGLALLAVGCGYDVCQIIRHNLKVFLTYLKG